MSTEQKVARALIKIGAVGFAPENPVTFKSGIISPVYVDNRKFPFHPKEWKIVIEGFKDLIKEKNISFDVIAGVEAGGIPHSAALGFSIWICLQFLSGNKPRIMVKKVW
jgi:orotate phosphoribosyltransferase